MARKARNKREEQEDVDLYLQDIPSPPKTDLSPIEAKTPNQKRYINAIKSNVITFGTGPAGTGKTYVCTALAAQALKNKQVDRIILTRPAVEAGESLGFLPGELNEKFEPWIIPFVEVLNERLGKTHVEYLLRNGTIDAVPLAYMRGRTFNRSFVILDEAQNTTPTQMKMFLTRIGYDSTIVVNGDMDQIDIHGPSGLEDAVRRTGWIPQVSHIEFKQEDIVRSGIVGDIVSAYSRKL